MVRSDKDCYGGAYLEGAVPDDKATVMRSNSISPADETPLAAVGAGHDAGLRGHRPFVRGINAFGGEG